jgi:hypothetical protein
MPPPPTADWQASLDRIEESLRAATRGLDRAEERWEIALAPSAGEGEPPVPLARLDTRLTDWEEKLRAAEELTLALERELAERARTLEEWRARFAKWAELIKRREAAPSPVT